MKITFFIFLLSSFAVAQSVDLSPMTFVGQKTRGAPPAQQSDFESSRYVHKAPPKHPSRRKPATTIPVQYPDDQDQEQSVEIQVTKPDPAPVSVELPSQKSTSDQHPLRSFLMGGSAEEVENYRNHLEPEDLRKNILELKTGVGYLFNSSASPYYFRNYSDASPSAFVGVDIWATPFLGLSTSYRSSMMNEVREAPQAETYLKDTQQWFSAAFKLRRFSGIGPTASSVVFSLGYSEYDFRSAADSLYRMRQSTRAMEVGLDLDVPSSKKYSWQFGVGMQPLSFHSETEAAQGVKSGVSNDAGSVFASVGGEYRMNRETRGFFKISVRQYKVQFSGQSNTVDPVTGFAPSNVPVSNNFIFIDLGIVLGR